MHEKPNKQSTIAVITADIHSSQSLDDPSRWIDPIENILQEERNKQDEEIDYQFFRGDSFQVEMTRPEEALLLALKIKASIKKTDIVHSKRLKSPLDLRMAIGIGEKAYTHENISLSNGTAFVRSGQLLDELKGIRVNLAIASHDRDWDRMLNLYFEFAMAIMDNWTINDAEMMMVKLYNPDWTQERIGTILGITQHSVSARMKRAYVEILLKLEAFFREETRNRYI